MEFFVIIILVIKILGAHSKKKTSFFAYMVNKRNIRACEVVTSEFEFHGFMTNNVASTSNQINQRSSVNNVNHKLLESRVRQANYAGHNPAKRKNFERSKKKTSKIVITKKNTILKTDNDDKIKKAPVRLSYCGERANVPELIKIFETLAKKENPNNDSINSLNKISNISRKVSNDSDYADVFLNTDAKANSNSDETVENRTKK